MSDIKNWDDYKNSLLEGVDNTKKREQLDVLMENVHKENNKALGQPHEVNQTVIESTAPGSTTTSNISRYDMMFMPMVRRVMPSLLAMDLVGVQPVSGPQGIVRTMRFRYSEDTLSTEGGTTNTVTAGDEASGQNIYEKYSFLALGGAYDDVDTLNPFEQTTYLEGNRGKPMNLDVATDRVDTYGRKLSSSWSLESQDDLDALDGLNVEEEINQALSDEIMRELDRELITELNGLAGTVESFDFANVDGRYAGEKLSALLIAFDNLSAQIAMKTRRSGATFMVVSQRLFTAMKNASNSTFVPANGGELELRSTLFVGTYGANVSVYVDPYLETDTVLMGRKGTELDTGLIYLPYIPLSSSGVVVNPETGDNRVMMRTRYGLYKATDPANSLNDAADHYAKATVANLELGFSNV